MKKNTISVSLFFVLVFILTACTSAPSSQNSLIGSTAPNFKLDNTLGGQTSLSDYEGTPVLLFFHMAVG